MSAVEQEIIARIDHLNPEKRLRVLEFVRDLDETLLTDSRDEKARFQRNSDTSTGSSEERYSLNSTRSTDDG